jgi:hypothetical protein
MRGNAIIDFSILEPMSFYKEAVVGAFEYGAVERPARHRGYPSIG